MTDFVPSEKGVTIRQPSTANFLVDSRDGFPAGNVGSSSDFTITKTQSLLNGFFTRIAVPEMVLEWSEPNVSGLNASNAFQYDVSGFTILNLVVPDGFYTAYQGFQALVKALNDVSGSVGNVTWTISNPNGNVLLTPSSGTTQARLLGVFAGRLGFVVGTYSAPGAAITANRGRIDMRPYRYLDFVSNQLTYNQELKDATTSRASRDVLVRWYFSYDEQPQLDAYGLPILMGYTQFRLRRQFNTPKQIKWAANQPIGQVSFQVYPDAGIQRPISMDNSLWEMTLQVSEV